MFFKKRRWALRVVERMGVEIKSPVATCLVAMINQGSKQMADMARGAGGSVDDAECSLIAAVSLRENQSAKSRLISDAGVPEEEVDAVFEQAWWAARDLAERHHFHELLERLDSSLLFREK